MRLGSFIGLQNLKAVQSYSWNLIRPLGGFQNVLSSLDDYECDEIAVIRITRGQPIKSSFENDISVLEMCKSATPLSFGGGIRNKLGVERVSKLPVERIIFSSQIFSLNTTVIEAATDLFGRQAIQILLPFKYKNNSISFYNSQTKIFEDLNDKKLELVNDLCNEVILYDTQNEGLVDNFDFRALDSLNFDRQKVVISGGVGPEVIKVANQMGLASVLIENRTLYSEYTIRDLKKYARM